jgi:hypothetical protein
MEALKAAGSVILGLAVLAALVFVAALFIVGTATVSELALPILDVATAIGVLVCVLVLLPLSIFRATRIVAVWGFFVASYIFGVDVWMYGFLITYALWGAGGLLVGLILGIVGVVPLGMIASAVNGVWFVVFDLAFGVAITYGARVFSLFLANSLDRIAMKVG